MPLFLIGSYDLVYHVVHFDFGQDKDDPSLRNKEPTSVCSMHLTTLPPFLFFAKVYPFGIPALYAAILWRKRELLNPRLQAIVIEAPLSGGASDEAGRRADSAALRTGAQSSVIRSGSRYHNTDDDTPPRTDWREFNDRVKARKEHPELAPSMFLWRDFGEGDVLGHGYTWTFFTSFN